MRLRPAFRQALCLAVAALTTLTMLSPASYAAAAEVDPGTGPDYEMPFPCGGVWTGSTRSSHSPSTRSVDFNRPEDLADLMVSAAPGLVTRVADLGSRSYGRYVIVDHGSGTSTLYAHLRSMWVTEGQRIDQGTILGTVGESGGVSGAHLHFEERLAGTVHNPYFHRTGYTFGTTSASQNCPDVPLAGDWDADGADQVAVFRRAAAGGVFRLTHPGAPVEVVPYGRNSDMPVTGDWDGDGRTDVGVRRPGRRTFLLRDSDGTTTVTRYGFRVDVPVTGDWDGDGGTEVGIWRPRSATFHLLHDTGAVTGVRLGHTGSLPVTGDWDGDGVTDLGVWDPDTATYQLRTVQPNGSVTFATVPLGTGTTLPVTGDWDGDGRTDIGVWNPSRARFSLRAATQASSQARTESVAYQRFGLRRR